MSLNTPDLNISLLDTITATAPMDVLSSSASKKQFLQRYFSDGNIKMCDLERYTVKGNKVLPVTGQREEAKVSFFAPPLEGEGDTDSSDRLMISYENASGEEKKIEVEMPVRDKGVVFFVDPDYPRHFIIRSLSKVCESDHSQDEYDVIRLEVWPEKHSQSQIWVLTWE